MPADRKYDVAFSFLTADLPLAQRLADALAPLQAFVYSRQQEEIVTQDGMVVFGAVFGEESSLNVVLYRAGYGERGWTNFEQETIKGRCLSEGWRSFALIRTDNAPVPVWVPDAYIYGDATLMDVEGLAGVICVRARTVGVNVEPQSAATRLARLAADREFDAETDRLATGREAFEAVADNLSAIHSRIAAVLAEHGRPAAGLRGEVGNQGSSLFGANLGNTGCLINYQNQFGSVTHGKVKIRIFDGRIAIPGTNQMLLEEARESTRCEATVIRSRALGWCWLFRDRARTSEQVADWILDELIQRNNSP